MADELESESAAALLQIKNGGLLIKEEVEDETEEEGMEVDQEVPTLGPAALGLQRVGVRTPQKAPSTPPAQVLNRRGMPARIRKKNRLFFDDDIVNTPYHRQPSAKKLGKVASPPKKARPQLTPVRTLKEVGRPAVKRISHVSLQAGKRDLALVAAVAPDKKIGQKIGLRLRNLLRLPKAQKWVCYEWFYSNIDRTLFSGDNDFMICLKESFPELKCRELTRIEWTKIRRMMGKPRRCSQSFFTEERSELEKKRNKIRALQQRKPADVANYKDLPAEIPLQLVIGTKVTARLRKPQDGLFTGSIDAVDTSNNTYRITFERQGLGTHSVPDYEVLSNEPPETITISSFQQKFRPKKCMPCYSVTPVQNQSTLKTKTDPLLSGPALSTRPDFNGKLGGFPVQLLRRMVLVQKILSIKRKKVNTLRVMNAEAERVRSFNLDFPEDFEYRYATCLVDLQKLNKDLETFLVEIQELCLEIAPESAVAAMLAPAHLRERCREEATEIMQRNNCCAASDKGPVTSGVMLDLIADLTALMLQVKSLSDSDQNAYELQVLQGTIKQVRSKLSPANAKVFQNCVEVHMQHIQNGLGQMTQLKAMAALSQKT